MHNDDIIPPMMRFQDKNEMKFVSNPPPPPLPKNLKLTQNNFIEYAIKNIGK